MPYAPYAVYAVRHMRSRTYAVCRMLYGICKQYAPYAVCLMTYGSASSSGVRLSGSAPVCSSVRQCARQCVGLCVAVFGSKHSCVRAMHAMRTAVWGSVIVSVRGSAWQCVACSASVQRSKCVAVRSTYIHVHRVAHNIYSVTGAVRMSLIFLAY